MIGKHPKGFESIEIKIKVFTYFLTDCDPFRKTCPKKGKKIIFDHKFNKQSYKRRPLFIYISIFIKYKCNIKPDSEPYRKLLLYSQSKLWLFDNRN